jgi:hypothetical protein
MTLYCDARPAVIPYGTPNPFHANQTRLARDNARAQASNTLIGRSFVYTMSPGRYGTVQIVKATKLQVLVRPCLDLGEPGLGIQRGTTLSLPLALAQQHLTATSAPVT